MCSSPNPESRFASLKKSVGQLDVAYGDPLSRTRNKCTQCSDGTLRALLPNSMTAFVSRTRFAFSCGAIRMDGSHSIPFATIPSADEFAKFNK
jgi:hypothetical protein